MSEETSLPPLEDEGIGIDIVEPPNLSLVDIKDKKDAEEEEEWYKADEAKAKARLAKLTADGLEQDIKERLKYAKWIFGLILSWIISVYIVILFQGFSESTVRVNTKGVPIIEKITFQPKFKLSDTILLALIGGTTVNVIGIFIIVANYLFPKTEASKVIQEKKEDTQ